MKYEFVTPKNDVIKIDLTDSNDIIIVNEPQNIIAFQSDDYKENRYDFIFDEIKLKKLKFKSRISGKSTVYLKSSNNSEIKIMELKNENFVFNYNVLMYTHGIKIKATMRDIQEMAIIKNIFQYECSGTGTIVYYAEGNLIELNLNKHETIFVHPAYVLGHDEQIHYEFRTYGNTKAAMRMDYHYKFTGPGRIIIQSQSLSKELKTMYEPKENILKKTVQDWFPGSNIFFK
jgi:hypothetical protein